MRKSVLQSNNYYPFGLQHNTSWTRPAEQLNNRLYNSGVELNEQTKNYETFYRDYDPAVGRFNQIDPLASSFGSITPYNYAFNDPVALNDPNGDCPSCEFWEEVYERLADLGSSGATSWTSGGGWTDVQGGGFNEGAAYNTRHNSWGNTYFQNEGASYIAMDAMNHGATWEQAVTIVEGSGFEADGFTFLNEVIVTATSVDQNGGSIQAGMGFSDYFGNTLTLLGASSYNLGKEMAKWAPVKDGWGRTVIQAGTNYKPWVVNLGKTMRGAGVVGGIASGLYTINQMRNGEISSTQGLTDLTFNVVSFIGVPGLIIGGVYTLNSSMENYFVGTIMQNEGLSKQQATSVYGQRYADAMAGKGSYTNVPAIPFFGN